MKSITLLTVGTRGDVQPFIALGLGLQRSSYAVTGTLDEPRGKSCWSCRSRS